MPGRFFISVALAAMAVLAAFLLLLLPAYTLILATVTMIRASIRCGRFREDKKVDRKSNPAPLPGRGEQFPWSNIGMSMFLGRVYHIRHQPVVHTFSYPLHFCVVDLDEAPGLFGPDNVTPCKHQNEISEGCHGKLWPLSTLILLRDEHHLKNGEGAEEIQTVNEQREKASSLKSRIEKLVLDRTNGKVDIRGSVGSTPDSQHLDGIKRRVVLVTHLKYFGYCFNPVSFYFIFKSTSKTTEGKNGEDAAAADNDSDELEAIVVEVSNTPWNEMSVYVLHPESVDVTTFSTSSSTAQSKSYRYQFGKNFHVSPFMTMDHMYDWTFEADGDRIQVTAKMIRLPPKEKSEVSVAETVDNSPKQQTRNSSCDHVGGTLFFTAGFDIRRQIPHPKFWPLQLAWLLCRLPMYCFIIQVWIHYEAARLFAKGVEFVPHPEGSETSVSRIIGATMAPIFVAKDWVNNYWSGKGTEDKKLKGS